MKFGFAQINTTVGDLSGNVDLMAAVARQAADGGARIVAFPELSVTGYPPRDLIEKPSFLDRTAEQLDRLAAETAGLGIAVICGYVGRTNGGSGKAAHVLNSTK